MLNNREEAVGVLVAVRKREREREKKKQSDKHVSKETKTVTEK